MFFLQSQGQSYFNKTYDWGSNVEQATGLIESPDLNGYCFVSFEFFSASLIFRRLDSAGNAIFSKKYSDEFYGYPPGYDPIHVISNNKLLIVGNRVDTTDHYWGFIMVTDLNGDSLFSREVHIGYETILSAGCAAPDGGFFLCGYSIANPIEFYQVLLVKTDSLGNVEWSKTFGQQNLHERGLSIEFCNDGGLIIGSERIANAAVSYSYAIKTDPLGTIQWQKAWGQNHDGGGCYIIPLSDGRFLAASAGYFGGSQYLDGYGTKLDSSGNIIWESNFGTWEDDFFNSKPIELIDGNYVFMGHTYSDSNPSEPTWILKTDSHGVVIWSRNIYSPDELVQESFNISLCDDGGFVIAGLSWHQNQDAWAVKVDEYGCQYPGCQLIANEAQLVSSPILVYPNPGNDFLVVRNEKSGENEFQLFDVNGRIVLSGILRKGETEFNTIQLPAGIYYYRILSGEEIINTGKWVKQE